MARLEFNEMVPPLSDVLASSPEHMEKAPQHGRRCEEWQGDQPAV